MTLYSAMIAAILVFMGFIIIDDTNQARSNTITATMQMQVSAWQ